MLRSAQGIAPMGLAGDPDRSARVRGAHAQGDAEDDFYRSKMGITIDCTSHNETLPRGKMRLLSWWNCAR